MLLNQDDYKKAIPVSASFTFDKITPDVRRAERKFLKPILGKDLLSSLDGKYAADTLNAAEQELMEFIQDPLAHLATWLYAPKGNLMLDDNQLSSTHSEDSKPAFEWTVNQFKDSVKQNGFDALNDLIEHLEDVANIDFPDWLTSEGCTLVRKYFINSVSDFNELVPKIKNSRYLFIQLQPIMKRVEKHLIKTITGVELFDEIKAQIKLDSLTALNLALMENIQEAVAHESWAIGLEELAVIVDDEGIHLLNNSFSGTIKGKQPADSSRITSQKLHHLQIAKEAQALLKDYLYDNADDYPLFKNSAVYIDPETVTETDQSDSGIYNLC